VTVNSLVLTPNPARHKFDELDQLQKNLGGRPPDPGKLDDLDRLLASLRKRRKPRAQGPRVRGGRPTELSKDEILEFVHAVKSILEAYGWSRKTRKAVRTAIEVLQRQVLIYAPVKKETLRKYCLDYWDSPQPIAAAPKRLARDRLRDALREHGPCTPQDVAEHLGISLDDAHDLTKYEKKMGRIIPVAFGKCDLPKAGVKAWVSEATIIVQVLVDAPSHQIRGYRLSEAMLAIGRSPNLSSALATLRRGGAVDPPSGGLVKLSSAAWTMIERGDSIPDRRGAVLWAPHMKKSLRKLLHRKVIYTDKVRAKDKMFNALRDHGSLRPKKLVQLTGLALSTVIDLKLKSKKAGEIICDGHGRYALRDSGAETWVPKRQIIMDSVIAAPDRSSKYSALIAAVVAAGGSPYIESPLGTLCRHGLLTRYDGGLIELSKAGLEKIKRAKPIYNSRGLVLWTPRAVE
jgi:hypothetical protein